MTSRSKSRSKSPGARKAPHAGKKVRSTRNSAKERVLPGRAHLREPPRDSLAKRRSRAAQIFDRLAAVNPAPRCELYHKTPFQLLVSVVLSAQTTDRMVNLCMQPLYDAGFDVTTVLRLGADGLLPHIKRIGFAPTKSKNIDKLAALIQAQHQGQVPRHRADLEALPGVGRKTANVVLAEIWSEPTLAVDTHVFRVGARLGLHHAPTPEKAEPELLQSIDKRYLPAAHHWLILHGRYTCKAIKPACDTCLLRDLCPSLG